MMVSASPGTGRQINMGLWWVRGVVELVRYISRVTCSSRKITLHRVQQAFELAALSKKLVLYAVTIMVHRHIQQNCCQH